ncbi:MAG: T9SS type A sorting domain-containing protein, partial [Bacteroidia bacterium]|nr:T9SS type A sorting domain-containing protein [Bacteroidia bacterium]
PAAAEVCNGVDDDCDGTADDGLTFLDYYSDDDSDGFGDVLLGNFCQAPASSSLQNGDCDDLNAAVNPAATEVCNGVDDDCDGTADDGLTFLDYYVDGDGDGFGDGAATSSCNPIAGSVNVNGDCDDLNAAVNPAATEVCNGVDDDCDGTADDGLTFLDYYVDGDGDGFGAGAATSSCNPIAGSVIVNGDCDDLNAAVNPAAAEVCNGVDDDCDGTADDGLTFLDYYVDGDGDGFGAGTATSSCNPIAGSVTVNGDCDDLNAAVNPATAEVCNGVDDDCDGTADDGLTFVTYYADADGDGFGNNAVSQSTCNGAPVGYILDNSDCDDTQLLYADGDLDGFGAGAPVACGVATSNDCNDNDATVNPAAAEVCNGVDDDCNGVIDDNVIVPIGTIAGPAQQCVPVIFNIGTFSISPVATANSYFWTVPSGISIVSGQGTNSILVSWTAQSVHNGIVGQISVTASTSCGAFATTSTLMDINYTAPVAPSSISGPAKVCPGDIVTYSVANVARASSYTWTVPAGITILNGNGTNIITASVSGSYGGGSVSVSAVNVCGTGPARSKTISFNTPSTPAVITGLNTGLCGTSSAVFTTAGSPNATSYTWNASSGITILNGQGSNSITVSVSSSFTSGLITVTGVNGCGSGNTRTLTIYGAPGQPAVISGPVNLCPGQSGVTYEIPTTAGATSYAWTVPGGATIVSGQGSKTIVVNFGPNPSNGQVISVRASNACGQGSTRSLSGISLNFAYCNGPRYAEEASIREVSVYPNPARQSANIQFISTMNSNYELYLNDLSGRTLMREQGEAIEGVNSKLLNIGELSTGIYSIVIRINSEMHQLRLMVE